MPLPVFVIALRYFLRLLLGLILLSSGASKLVHPGRFRRGIQDYQLIAPALESRLAVSTLLAYGLPVVEILAGLGLIGGVLLVPSATLAIILMIIFSLAMVFSLAHGRTDLSCHCGGAIGDHRISWWLVGRNGLFVLGLCVLLFTPVDTLTVGTPIRSPSAVSTFVWMNTILPVVLLVGMVLMMLVLVDTARAVFRS